MKNEYDIDATLLQLISSEQAYHYNVVPMEAQNGTIVFKSDQPTDILRQELQIVLNKDITLVA